MAEDKISIVFALPSFLVGGTERQLLKQLKYYNQARYRITLVTLFEYPGRPTLYDELPNGVTIVRLNFRSWFDVISWQRLWGALHEIKPRIVVSSAFRANTVFRLIKPFFRYAIITREHNMYVEKTFFQKCVDAILSPCSCAQVAISSTVANYAATQAHIPRSRFTVILNGIDLESIDNFRSSSAAAVALLRKELKLSENKKILLNVARLKPQKDQRMLIDAFLKFKEKHRDYVLCIVGEGSERESLERYISDKKAINDILLVGFRSDVYSFFAAAEAFVFSSLYEGGANTPLEALAFGLPVVSTPVAGVDEYLVDGENGFLARHTATDFAVQLERLAACISHEINTIRMNARKTAENFSIPSVVRNYEHIIDRCIKSR